MNLTAAGNTVIPAIKALLDLGYQVRVDSRTVIAQKDGNIFTADDPVMVLGLVKLYETRGDNWQVSDEELQAISGEYGLF
jgi:hypothetical protein